MNYPESVEAYTVIDDANAMYATILLHATKNPEWMSTELRSAAALPGIFSTVYTLQSAKNRQMDTIRKTVTVVGSLGAIASWLAVIGVFGLLAFAVAQRTHEIGVRIALGASAFNILQCVLGQLALSFAIGAVLGIALSAAAAMVMRGLLFGFIPFDVVSFGAGMLMLGVFAFLASLAPVRRALRIDPASALRYE